MTDKKIVLLDGGMGQELVHRGVAHTSPMWGAQVMIDTPELVQQLHIDYLQAGAKVITLNTYSVTPERLANVGAEDQFPALQQTAFELASRARDASGVGSVSIAACLPPLFGSYQPDKAPVYEIVLETYQRIVEQQAGAVDVFLCETMSSIKEAKASATAATESGKPVWVALSVDDDCSGCLRSGETIADAYEALKPLPVEAILLNCSMPEAIDAAWPHLQMTGATMGAYANGFTSVEELPMGGGVEMLKARKDLGPQEYSRFAMEWVDSGADLIGGCCEISPAHIKDLAAQLAGAGYQIADRL